MYFSAKVKEPAGVVADNKGFSGEISFKTGRSSG
jgi:hypothetical protein